MTVTKSNNSQILKTEIIGSRRFSNYWWATIVSMGGTGFLLAGLSSYLHQNLIPFTDATSLIFIPQGAAMTFYGVAGLLVALYLWLTITWDVGGGYNEYNKETQRVTIFRWGYPGKNRQIEISCDISDVQSVRVDIKDGLNPKRVLYLKVKGKRDIPLTSVGQPMSLNQLENEAAQLARFLSVPIEGL